MQKDLSEVKIFQKVLEGLLFSETPCRYVIKFLSMRVWCARCR